MADLPPFASALGDGAHPAGARFPGVLDLQGSLSRVEGARVWRYLPLKVTRTEAL